jgi:hypothetical protein
MRSAACSTAILQACLGLSVEDDGAQPEIVPGEA